MISNDNSAPKWQGIHHLAMITPDMDETVRFYCGVLGMPLVATLRAGPMRHYFFELGPGNTIAFFEDPRAETFTKPAGLMTRTDLQFDHLSFALPTEEDLKSLIARLKMLTATSQQSLITRSSNLYISTTTMESLLKHHIGPFR